MNETSQQNFNGLIAGTEISAMTAAITFATTAAETIYPRGTVLGIKTADNTCAIVDKTSTDGTEKAKYVLANETKTSATETVNSVAYKTGVFAVDKLTFGGTDTAGDHELEMRELNIHMKGSM